MDPSELIRKVQDSGCKLVTNGGRLFVTPPGKLPASLRPLLEAAKAEVVALLEAKPKQLSDADIDALAALVASEPPAESVALPRAVILTWPCGTKLALSEQALAEWDAQSAECRRLPPARYRPGRSESDLFTQDPEET